MWENTNLEIMQQSNFHQKLIGHTARPISPKKWQHIFSLTRNAHKAGLHPLLSPTTLVAITIISPNF